MESEVELYKTMTQNCNEVVKVLIKFFRQSFKEIVDSGFDLVQLKSVQAVLDKQHISQLVGQILKLRSVQDQIEQELPSVRILEDFYDLLSYILKSCRDKKRRISAVKSN